MGDESKKVGPGREGEGGHAGRGRHPAEMEGNRRGASKKLRTVMIKPRSRQTPSRERKDIRPVTWGDRDTGRRTDTQGKTTQSKRPETEVGCRKRGRQGDHKYETEKWVSKRTAETAPIPSPGPPRTHAPTHSRGGI